MGRRLLRASSIIALAAVVGLAVMSQFDETVLFPGRGIKILAVPQGILIVGLGRSHMVWSWVPVRSFPWWIILAFWIVLTSMTWFLTRRRKVARGFPVEPQVRSR
jgi:hypothetical protein